MWLTVQSPLSVAQFAGKWASCNAPPDLPYDQREEDGGSLVFDTDILTERVEILGSPSVELELSVSEPVAMVAARLSDVAPDGRATRVTYGLLNLTHRDGVGAPRTAGTRSALPSHRAAQRRGPGVPARPPHPAVAVHVVLAPPAWLPPGPVLLTVYEGSSALTLPLRGNQEPDEAPQRPFGEPEGTPPVATTQLTPPEQRWDVKRDLVGYHSERDRQRRWDGAL